jgi:hypothetical protein
VNDELELANPNAWDELLDKAAREFESGRLVFDGYSDDSFVDSRGDAPDLSIAPTGEEYIEIVTGVCFTPEGAVQSWLASAKEVTQAKSGNLYWRIRPELWNDGPTRWKVYSLLLVSGKIVKNSYIFKKSCA